MSEVDKQQRNFLKENWKEVIGFLYNNIREEDLFEHLLEQYEPREGFFKILQEIILVNENWFTSNISFETKIALLKEIIGKDSKLLNTSKLYCETCGSNDFEYKPNSHEEELDLICKHCKSKITTIDILSLEF